MNKLAPEMRARVLHLLCEGMSIRAITRATGVSKTTVSKLLNDVGAACADYPKLVVGNSALSVGLRSNDGDNRTVGLNDG